MTSMIERVAGAIYGEAIREAMDAGRNSGALFMWKHLPASHKAIWHGRARAAIEAMREPSHGMVDVGTEARWRSAIRDADSVREIWQAMIDAALAESKEG